MDIEFDHTYGISSSPAGRGGMAMPRLHTARYADGSPLPLG